MSNNNKRRSAALILAVFILFSAVTSLFVVVHEASHECVGENCPVCEVIAICQNTLKSVCFSLIALALLFGFIYFAESFIPVLQAAQFDETPVSLKVKLLN